MSYLDKLVATRADLIEQRDAALAEMESATATAVEEDRSALTDEEEAFYTEARAKVDSIDEQLVPLDSRIAELSDLAERQALAANVPQFMQRVETSLDRPEDTRRMTPGEIRDKGLAMLEARKDDIELRDDSAEKLDRTLRRHDHNLNGPLLAERLILTENDDYRSAWQKLVSQPTPLLTPEEARAVQAFQESRAASLTAAAGGYGVPVLIDPTIILSAQGSFNPFRRISRVETITTDVWKGVASAGVTWSYDSEGAEVSDDAPTLTQPSVTTAMARGFIPFSIEIGQDYPNFASEMSRLLGEGYDELQAEAFATGSGNPVGILTAITAPNLVTPTTDGAFGAVDIGKVWNEVPARFRANATWVMANSVGDLIAGFGNGNNISDFTVNLAGVISMIRNRPIEFSSYFPDFSGTTGAANILAVGDFRNYLIADRAGMSVELVPHIFHTSNNRPAGVRGWFAWARHGADSINDPAFRVLANA